MSAISLTTEVSISPVQLAEMFWELDAEQQADFFAKLDEVAGLDLCFQMAAVVREIQQRSDRGDHAAMNGFRTMLAHAQEYSESAMDYRASDEKRAIARMAGAA